MDIEALTTFHRVAKVGSITKAADDLFLAIGTVTGRLKALETEIGKPLFLRIGRRIDLTEEGEQFLKYVEHFLSVLDQGQEKISLLRETHAGRLDIAVTEPSANYILPLLLHHFKETYPGIEVHLMIYPDYLVVDKVMGGKVELGVVDQSFSGLTTEPWFDNRMLPVVASNHPLAGREQVSWQDLLSVPILSYSARAQEEEFLGQKLREEGIEKQLIMRIQHAETIKSLLEPLQAVSFLPRICLMDELEQGSCVVLPLQSMVPIRWSTSFIYRQNLQLSLAAKTFLKFSGHYIGQALPSWEGE